ncbi:Magnesium transport protein CorA [Luteitalea pratensis]|uniref:Magnesium transport protein CorA n=1 Tax=Luteitalea pratensis TaxID=1855912 RepID=A0A143PNB5_LUTPR|nr:magnesium transporter CorA family protein [Luteitalea pratensis]AMY09971.1 Magnesium transport protein CorA [Luteitalea pratensis]
MHSTDSAVATPSVDVVCSPSSDDVLTVFVHAHGQTRRADAIDPSWLAPDSGMIFWADLGNVDPAATRHILSDTFRFHELSVEDAVGSSHHPKVEPYDGYLYLILHGIDWNATQQGGFTTHDIDFFIGPNYLVTVHNGASRSIASVQGICPRNGFVLGDGPEVSALEDRLDAVEEAVFSASNEEVVRQILHIKRDVGSLRRVVMPQRDVIARLARREFAIIDEALSYKFRDVHDHLVRLADEANTFHDRVTGVLDAHLSFVSNRMNEVMKVLTLIATIFMPLTVLTSLYGMNVKIPLMPGSDGAQFWDVVIMMAVMTGAMVWYFKRRGWI